MPGWILLGMETALGLILPPGAANLAALCLMNPSDVSRRLRVGVGVFGARLCRFLSPPIRFGRGVARLV